MTTGERIKSARSNAGLTQQELADKLGVSFQSVGQYEQNRRNPKRETLKKIADAIGVSIYELMDPEEEKVNDSGPRQSAASAPDIKKQPAPESGLSPARKELLDIVDGMTEEEIRHLISIIRAVIGMRK